DFDFRIWDEDNEEFYKNPSIFKIKQIKGPHNVVLSSYSDNERINFEGYDRKFEVELFTRLYDKNGKKVYENDIVKAKNPFNYLEAKISIHKEGTFYLENKSGHYMGSLIYLVEDEGYTIEIIGNIHENPELLKC
ncbi:YopX family protein, partial [Campylobacter jejuni]